MEKQAGIENPAGVGKRDAKIYKVELMDRGQDLTTLYVVDGVIVYCGLFQRLIWEGRVLTAKVFEEGDIITFSDSGRSLVYPVISVEQAERDLTYGAWLEQIDTLAWEQWGERTYTANTGAGKPGDPWIEAYLNGSSPLDAWDEEVSAACS
ncbi:hypothetical protein WS63_07885 [Burkholderia stagnalis]|uniref:hypothetical protein n=1 Tax=Burkholderia stagnalis TaxID=1503054 RepID=UPI000758B4FC|nr:hypothetical protein [Burkholderia stagnalis]KVD92946.1 hypothetical protein WS63_07885 [Burkholderia stagnalis]